VAHAPLIGTLPFTNGTRMKANLLEFADLADLRLFLRETIDRQPTSLKHYFDAKTGGFYHRHDKPTPGDFSKSSTATCVLSLIATGNWQTGGWADTGPQLLHNLLHTEWKDKDDTLPGFSEIPPGSAGLPPGNAFTCAWLLEAALALLSAYPDEEHSGDNARRMQTATDILLREVQEEGGASIQGYPRSAYVTQLVARVIRKRGALTAALGRTIADWSEREMQRQLALLSSGHKTGDPFQVAYSVVLTASLIPEDQAGPDDELILDAALNEFFRHQRDDGTWPLSRPLFHYPNVGSAHCFDYELLVQMLETTRLREKLLRFLPQLAKAAFALKNSSFQLPDGGKGWSSGHHPQLRGPESWSTASVYHFAHSLERLVAEQVRQSTFAYLDSHYTTPEPAADCAAALSNFLDCDIKIQGVEKSLKQVLAESILTPLINQQKLETVSSGRPLPKEVPMSMIFFGPPGTSKTRLAEIISSALGWPLLSIDPSHFVRGGLDGVYAESNRVFGMLAIVERVVILLDEFDEMVRDRGGAADVLSRFLTTAMLPKIIKINENRRVVFIVATNHIEAFDVAISRPGRFDAILQVMPPKSAEKRKKWPLFDEIQQQTKTSQLDNDLKFLTYAECDMLVRRLKNSSDKLATIRAAAAECTLKTPYSPADKSNKKDWATICEEQSTKSRVM
jgi:hypothetical protein